MDPASCKVGVQLKCAFLVFVLLGRMSSGESLNRRLVLKVAVVDRVSSTSISEKLVTVPLSSHSKYLTVNITILDTHINSSFILVDKVLTMVKTTDVVIVSDVLCDHRSMSGAFTGLSTPVICIIDEEGKLKTDNDNTQSGDLEISSPSYPNGITHTDESYVHLFSELSLIQQDVDKLSSVLNQLLWTTIMIIYQDSTEFAAKTVANQLELKGTQIFMYNIESSLQKKQLHAVLMSGYNEMLDNQRNILLLCSTNCARKVTAQAEAFDRMNEGSTALHYFSNWLIVSQSPHLCEQRNIQITINNVAVLALPSRQGTTPLKNRVQQYLREVLDILEVSNYSRLSLADLRQEAIKLTIETIRKRQQEVGRIMTLLWKQEGRSLSTVAHINSTNHVNIFTDIFPNSKMGFNKKRFKIGTLPWYPYIIRGTKNGKTGYTGYCIDLLEELAASLNFSYFWKEPDDGEWGRIQNNSWTGLVGQIQDKEVEMLVAPLGISSEREFILDFIFPFIYDYTAVLYKTPDPNRNKWRQLLAPFKWQVLLCIGVSLFSIGIIFWLVEKWNPFYAEVPTNAFLPPRKNFEDTILFVYGCLLIQGGSHTPRSASGRVLIAFWWLFSIVVAAIYSGNLIAFLTVNKDKPPFETLLDLTSQTEYKWGTLGGSIWVQRFQTSNRTEFKGLWKGIEEFRISDPDVLSLDQQVHLDKVDQGGYGFIADKSAMEISASSKCDLQFLKEVFYPIHYAIALPNNSPYFKLFSDEMLKVHESGLLQIWKRRWWPRQSMCKGSLLSEAKTIQLIDIQSAFYVVGIGLVLATGCVLIEAYVTPRGRKRRRVKEENEDS